jgi:hypothetical protein
MRAVVYMAYKAYSGSARPVSFSIWELLSIWNLQTRKNNIPIYRYDITIITMNFCRVERQDLDLNFPILIQFAIIVGIYGLFYGPNK